MLILIKSYLIRSSTDQDRIDHFSIILIENQVAKRLNHDDIINDFAAKKNQYLMIICYMYST